MHSVLEQRKQCQKQYIFSLGKQICFTIVWGCAETLPATEFVISQKVNGWFWGLDGHHVLYFPLYTTASLPMMLGARAQTLSYLVPTKYLFLPYSQIHPSEIPFFHSKQLRPVTNPSRDLSEFLASKIMIWWLPCKEHPLMNKLVEVATILGRKKEHKISFIFQDLERPNDIDAQCV